MEDFAVIKLMEEITELDQEMKLKKSQIENRMQLLNRLLQHHENPDKKEMIETWLMKIKDGEATKRITYEDGKKPVEGEEGGD